MAGSCCSRTPCRRNGSALVRDGDVRGFSGSPWVCVWVLIDALVLMLGYDDMFEDRLCKEKE